MHCPSCGADAGDASKYCPSCDSPLSRGEPDEYIGRTIAQKYQVEALIGEGGMGKVYRARQVTLDKLVVLKVLRHTLLGDDRTVARFKREAKAASRLNHANSISILDFGIAEDGALFIAMEFVPGQDLHTVLSKDGPLPEPRIVRIVSQVLSALYDAHNAGVIHRDLKPENIMVEQRRNEPDFVKVLDFGIAKIQDAEGEGPALTRTGFVCGTPEYMSPEQARGATLDHRSDLYAVGVILYQLLTGRLPFESDSAVGYATKHLTEEPLPPSRKRSDIRVSPAMERLIMRALSKSPDDRPQDAEAFKAELLAVEKERERRSNASPAVRRGAPAPGVLAPLPRRATPPPTGVSTELTDPGWGGESDATVRAMPERMQPVSERMPPGAALARASAERTQLAPPSRPPPERERPHPAPLAAVRSATDRFPPERPPLERATTERSLVERSQTPDTAIMHDKTEALVATVPDAGGNFGFLKAFVLTLALVTLGLVAWWMYTNWRNQSLEQPFVPPKNAPIPGQESGAYVPAPGVPLYEQDIPADKRNPREAQRRQQAGYTAFKSGDLEAAATEYSAAFAAVPSPELSLILGELYWALDKHEEARAWWKRHLRDLPASQARATLLLKEPQLASAAGSR
ncbi:serine/threonine-protein kinase [Archangium gephyra]|uniref:non-specific serine/threonine protein kinase n=2 Tax=Archangium gephyra TaxID=48 RepID=A0AAC8QC35_9BACT|nr:Serine/threonine protein kinase PrkC, regulator of stationary phase [Archangium gephyra]REG37224.1 serine/threonine-protein kinase [Archangium gephyra]